MQAQNDGNRRELEILDIRWIYSTLHFVFLGGDARYGSEEQLLSDKKLSRSNQLQYIAYQLREHVHANSRQINKRG